MLYYLYSLLSMFYNTECTHDFELIKSQWVEGEDDDYLEKTVKCTKCDYTTKNEN
jgi:hypothetical protein